LRNFFVSGVVGRITRGETLRKVFDERAHALLVNFLLVLNDHERLPLLPAILFEARQLQDERANRLPVHVHSATPLSDDQLKRIGDQIKQSMKLDPILENNVDPELLGGVLIRIGDFVFDGSIRTRLEQIRDQILSRGSYEIQSGRDRFSTAVGN
jgi:F-type H+-transporting ATPase subunit delta